MNSVNFKTNFKELTGHDPFPWQIELFKKWFIKGNIPASCSLPTGLGKTSVIAVWLLALMRRPDSLPRRLVYVVNRRTVVDQTTTEVERLRKQLDQLNGPFSTLQLSTLRGQFADNREWSADPSQPAVICGTVDMIGSHLLFSGYRIGYKFRPLHAGFLGQDSLLVHDEAHLEPAFQKLVESIADEQLSEYERTRFGRPMRVMQLSATARHEDNNGGGLLMLTNDDREHREVKKRITAAKSLNLHPCDDEKKKLVDQVVDLALKHKESGDAILVFLRSVEAVRKVSDKLEKSLPQKVVSLTGTMRGYERDKLVENPTFKRFLPDPPENTTTGTVYLVCTSAGEVGVNLSADHMICDLSTFDSMTQRLGRVNRFGNRNDTRIDLVHPIGLPSEKDIGTERKKKPNKQNKLVFIDGARRRTLELLNLLDGDASPKALTRLAERKNLPCSPIDAFAPMPVMLNTSDILFDAWAMTSITRPLTKASLPGCPPVTPYLHGIADWEPPQTQVAWREEVERISDDNLANRYPPEKLLAAYPLKPHELLRENTSRVYDALKVMHPRLEDNHEILWIVENRGNVERTTLAELLEKDKKMVNTKLADATVLLQPKAGGLSSGGLLDGKKAFNPDRASDYDVANLWLDEDNQPRRRRFISNQKTSTRKMKMRRVMLIDLDIDADGNSNTMESETG